MEDQKISDTIWTPAMVHTRQRSRMIDCLNNFQGSVKAQLSESTKHAESIKGEIIIQHTHAKSGLAKPICIQLYSLNDSCELT